MYLNAYELNDVLGGTVSVRLHALFLLGMLKPRFRAQDIRSMLRKHAVKHCIKIKERAQ